MLILTSYFNDRIVIRVPGHEDIIVTNVDRRVPKVRLGFTAAKEVEIDRERIRKSKDDERFQEEIIADSGRPYA